MDSQNKSIIKFSFKTFSIALAVILSVFDVGITKAQDKEIDVELKTLGSVHLVVSDDWHVNTWEASTRKWVIKIKFLEESSEVHKKVLSIAKEWEKHANIEFRKVDRGQHVSILFSNNKLLPKDFDRKNTGNFYQWSISNGKARRYMRLGHTLENLREANKNLLDLKNSSTKQEKSKQQDAERMQKKAEKFFRQTVLHEFGHLLGLKHEQQNPHRTIEWKVNALVDRMVGWQGINEKGDKLKSEVQRQIVNMNIGPEFLNTRYDPDSVMHYSYEKFEKLDSGKVVQLFEGAYNQIGGTDRISKGDAEIISLLYPKNPERVLGAAPDVKRPKDFLGTGAIYVRNNYNANDITLYVRHADNLKKNFKNYTINKKASTLHYKGSPLVVGGDWQVEIEFGNGVKSGRRTLSHVAKRRVFGKGTQNSHWVWDVELGDIYSGRRPK